PGEPFCHLLVVSPSSPHALPPALAELRFDRIAYATDELPQRVPNRLERHLKDWVQNGADAADPYFASFVPTLLRGGSIGPGDYSEPVRDDVPWARELGMKAGWRLKRDMCRVDWDASDVRAQWDRWAGVETSRSFPA